MNPFQAEYEVMIEALKEARIKVETIGNKDMLYLRNRIATELTKNINFLSTQIGLPLVQQTLEGTAKVKREPLTRMFGQDIKVVEKKNEPIFDDKAEREQMKGEVRKRKEAVEDAEVTQLRSERDAAYPNFTSMEAATILDSYSEVVIRAVAKKADLPVTETSPKKIDTKFIQIVKDAIVKKAELEQKKAAIEGSI